MNFEVLTQRSIEVVRANSISIEIIRTEMKYSEKYDKSQLYGTSIGRNLSLIALLTVRARVKTWFFPKVKLEDLGKKLRLFGEQGGM